MGHTATALAVLLVIAAQVVVADDEDYYDILGLGEQRDDAAERDIKNAWRKLSKQFHPDLHGESTREHYQKIQRAYEVLGDRKKRKVYDIRGEEGLKQLERPEQQHVDPFAALFGFGGGGGNANKGANINMLMLVSLEDMYNGAAHTVKFEKQKICRTCRGSGAASKGDLVICPRCHGSGQDIQRIQIAPGFVQQVQQPCSHCQGKGKRIGKKCPTCDGEKVVRAVMTLGVDVEQGTPENYDLVYDMEADQTPDQIPGDVIFTISSAPHKRFVRRGDDLHMTVNLTLKEALLGFEKTFKHLDDHDVDLVSERVVQHGETHRLEGEGMPKHHVPSEKGTLHVRYEVTLPSFLTEHQKDKIAALFPQ
jgi:DnaJ-class molecular chaperone